MHTVLIATQTVNRQKEGGVSVVLHMLLTEGIVSTAFFLHHVLPPLHVTRPSLECLLLWCSCVNGFCINFRYLAWTLPKFLLIWFFCFFFSGFRFDRHCRDASLVSVVVPKWGRHLSASADLLFSRAQQKLLLSERASWGLWKGSSLGGDEVCFSFSSFFFFK